MTYDHRGTGQEVARTANFEKAAELLTKQWLMGVRRGFLSQIPKTVHGGFDGALKAIWKLQRFMANLEDQVLLIRKGANTWAEGENEGKLFRAKLKLVNDAIYAAETSAEYWRNMSEGKVPHTPSEWDRQAVQQTLDLYARDFIEVFSHHIPTKGRGPKGTRSAGLVEIFDGMLKVLYEDAKRLEKGDLYESHALNVAVETPRIRSIGDMTFVVVAKFSSAVRVQDYFRACHKAYEKVKSRGLDKKSWYGVTFVMADDPKELSDEEQAEYKGAGYNIKSVLGDYSIRSNDIRLWSRPNNVESTLLHEIGHRYWFKHMKQEQRMQFIRSVWTKDKSKILQLGTKSRSEALKALIEAYETSWEKLQSVTNEIPGKLDKMQGWYDALTWAMSQFGNPFDSFIQGMRDAFAVAASGFAPELAKGAMALPEVRAILDFEKTQSAALYRNGYKELKELKTKSQAESGDDSDSFGNARYDVDNFFKLLTHDMFVFKSKLVAAARKVIPDFIDALYAEEVEIMKRQVKPVSDYGGTNADEAFAEVFKDYVLGKPMGKDQAQSFLSVVKDMRKQAAGDRVVSRSRTHRVVTRYLAVR